MRLCRRHVLALTLGALALGILVFFLLFTGTLTLIPAAVSQPASTEASDPKDRPGDFSAAVSHYTIFSGLTVSSNSPPVSSPRARTASFRVVPSARAFLAHLAAAS